MLDAMGIGTEPTCPNDWAFMRRGVAKAWIKSWNLFCYGLDFREGSPLRPDRWDDADWVHLPALGYVRHPRYPTLAFRPRGWRTLVGFVQTDAEGAVLPGRRFPSGGRLRAWWSEIVEPEPWPASLDDDARRAAVLAGCPEAAPPLPHVLRDLPCAIEAA